MDMTTEKQELCCCKILREAKAEQSVDCDITLPDYCADIKSILRCSIEAGITSQNITGNRITAEGNAVVRLVYLGENDCISCFEQNYPLSKYVEMSGITMDVQVVVKAKTAYVNCRAVSPRRVDVHGCVAVLFTALCCEKTAILSSACGEGYQLKQQTLSTYNCVGCSSKLFEMSEVVPIDEGTKKIKSVLRSVALPMLSETKVVSNKMLVKGDLQLSLTLCCEDGSIVKREHTMPISQIVDCEGVSEGCVCDVKLDVSSLDVQLKPDENGELNRIDAAVSVRSTAYGYQEVNSSALVDAYSIKKDLSLEKTQICEKKMIASLDEPVLVNSSLDFLGSEVKEILDCWCSDVTAVPSCEGNAVNLSGTVTVCLLYCNNEGKVDFACRQCDYRHQKEFAALGGKLDYEPNVSCTAVSVSGSGATLNARIQLNVNGCVFCCNCFEALCNLQESNAPKVNSASSITVYFADKDEQVWDIAKKYNTSPEAVRVRNALVSDGLEKPTMLIIPTV